MNIIRDESNPIAILPLLKSWKVERCNVEGCTAPPSTIVSNVPDLPVIGLCEAHFKEGEKAQKFNFKLEF